MPTYDRARALTPAGLAALTAAAVDGTLTTGLGVGLELELFPVTRERPTRRLRLHEPVQGVAPVDALVAASRDDAGRHGVSLTVEPGAQVELATGCCQQAPEALASLEAAVASVAGCFDRAGAALYAAGADPWHPLVDVPQQLTADRYRMMASQFAQHGPHGGLMMRHTCALQVNLDIGRDPTEREQRWVAANLLAPIATATFACSPGMEGERPVRSRRALAWQHLDPSRTGFPPSLVGGVGTAADHVLEQACRADVLLVRTLDGARHGRKGWSFGAWMTDGDPDLGWPTEIDAREHLTTLFPEVRARGFLELRSIDAGPASLRTATALLITAAIVDPEARTAITAVLAKERPRLPALARACAVDGLRDPRLCALAVAVWSYARDGAARLPGVAAHHLAAIDAFVDRYPVRGRCPADDLDELLSVDPLAAAAWVTEPVPTPTTAEVR